MSIWFVAYFFGRVVLTYGPLRPDNEANMAACQHFQTMMMLSAENQSDLGNLPIVDGKQITIEDVSSKCLVADSAPPIDPEFDRQ